MGWKLTIRTGPQIERHRFQELDEAVDALEARGRELEASASRQRVDVKFRRFEPVQQVVARLELSGPERLIPSLHAGVDVRGDGSVEAYLGRVRRQVVKQRRGESPYSSLRRALEDRIKSAA